MDPHKLLVAPPETSVTTAANMMETSKAGAVMVVESNRLVGIFTERDAVFRVIAKGLDPTSTPLVDVMTTALFTVSPYESLGYAMLVMYENGFRHMPVVVNGEPVGIVSARNALDPDLEEFAYEEHRRKNIRRFAEDV